jgi:uncharacterized membrane protein
MRSVSLGRAVFAAAMIALGIIGLIRSDYAAVWGGAPTRMPGREALAYICAFVALACGLGLIWRRTAVFAARALLVYLLLWLLVFKAHFIVRAPLQEVSYQTNGETAVIVAGAWVLYARLAGDWDRRWLAFAAGDSGVRIARVLYALGMIAFGLSHFVYLHFTAPLVPEWLGWPEGWAYFTGGAYLAAGAAMLSGVLARLAATLSAVQMGMFALLVWAPRVASGELSDFQWGEVVVTCVLTAAGWVVAESYRGARRFAVRARDSAPTPITTS